MPASDEKRLMPPKTLLYLIRSVTMAERESSTEAFCFVRLSVFTLSCWMLAAQVQGLSPDGQILLEIKSSFVDIPGNMSNWLATDASPCQWFGISCLEDGLSVRSVSLSGHDYNLSGEISASFGKLPFLQELDLAFNNLSGPLPKELGDCSDLRSIRLDSNPLISGSIPPEFANLSRLQHLSLSQLQLTGNIPIEFGNLKNLLNLSLLTNNLSGSIPPALGSLHELSILELADNSLSGPIPPELGNCKNLSRLILYSLQLHGSIPPTLGQLEKLQELDLTTNRLTGGIPPELGNCTSLTHIYLGSNSLSGEIPEQLGRLQNVKVLFLNTNSFSGEIPAVLGNMSSLTNLTIGENLLVGEIPPTLGFLRDLMYLNLFKNNLTGRIPGEMGNCTKLDFLYLPYNKLTGSVPPELGNLRLLSYLHLWNNSLNGIPSELGNCSNLQVLDIYSNKLVGSIPPEIAKLPRLRELRLYDNQLTGSIPSDLGLHSNLTHAILRMNKFTGTIPPGLCSFGRMQILDLSSNLVDGEVPVDVARCSTLYRLRLESNRLTGPIPKEIGQNKALSYLDARFNNLSSSIPSELGSCTKLTALLLSYNSLNGTIPSRLGQLPRLVEFNVSSNQLSGSIPSELGNLSTLSELDLSDNSLTGDIPLELSKVSNLRFLSLNDNRLTGLSNIWSSLGSLQGLQLAGNKFSGLMPAEIGTMRSLQIVLDLSRNHFSGQIPAALGRLQLLECLDLSSNNFSGEIPASLGDMVSLHCVNISYNNLVGALPSSWEVLVKTTPVLGNPELCYSERNCSSNSPAQSPEGDGADSNSVQEMIGGVGTLLAITLALILAGVFIYCRRRTRLDSDESSAKLEVWCKDHKYRDLTFRAILDATGEMSRQYVVHHSSSSTVYKASINNGLALAIKVLNADLNDRLEKEYRMEVETIGKVRHRNLVKMIGFCEWKKLRFVILEFLSKGSLFEVLHVKKGQGLSDWTSRYKVAMGIAYGLEYLHTYCDPQIIHRDIKSSNILLDDDFEPHISDFGSATLRDKSHPNGTASMVVGTHGYIAPECGYTLHLSDKVDVYSYGVVLLELLTGKQSLDSGFPEGTTIVGWVEDHIKMGKMVYELLDKAVLDSHDIHKGTEMLMVFQVAALCTKNVPAERPTMQKVVTMLQQVKEPQRIADLMNSIVGVGTSGVDTEVHVQE